LKKFFDIDRETLMGWIFVVLLAAGSGYMTVRDTVIKMKEVEPLVKSHETQIQIINTKLDYIKEGIDDLKKK